MTVSDARRRALELTQEVEHSRDTPADIVRKRERAHRTEQAAKTIPTIDRFIGDHYAKRLRASVNREVGEDRTTSPATVRRKLTSLRGLFSHAIRLESL